MTKLLIILILLAGMLVAGCLQHGLYEGQNVKTSLEYNERTNLSFSGKIVLIENTRSSYKGYGEQNDHYIITVYNKTLGSKQKFDEIDLVPDV